MRQVQERAGSSTLDQCSAGIIISQSWARAASERDRSPPSKLWFSRAEPPGWGVLWRPRPSERNTMMCSLIRSEGARKGPKGLLEALR